MKELEAAQLVYGNVEAARSARHRGGFQTVFHSTSSLTENEVTSEIEPRLFFDSATAGQQHKHVFFTMSDGRVVLARVIPLAGNDEGGRRGLYLGHALVFSGEDFRRLRNNPFPIFDNFNFFNSIDEAVKAGGNQLGDIPPARIQSSQPGENEYAGINREQLFQLSQFARGLLISSDRGSSIGFYGSSDNVLDILRDMFLLLPTHLRSRCSFDTLFAGGNYGRTPYFAFGLPAQQSRDRRFFSFDIGRGEFMPPVEPSSATSYDLWLKWMLHPRLSEIASHVDDAYSITALLEGEQRGADLQLESEDSLVPFRSLLEARLGKQVKTQIGALLGARILPRVFAWARQQGLGGFAPLTRGFSIEQLSAWVEEAYEQYHEEPSMDELEELERLSTYNERSFLRLISLRWSQQWHILRIALRRSETAVSNRFKKWALATVPVQAQLVVQPGQEFFLGLRLHDESEQAEETYALLSALLDTSAEPGLSRETNSGAPPSAMSLLSLLQFLVIREKENDE